jgi:uncharacterized protein (DUF697 family)/tellurite resistance protein
VFKHGSRRLNLNEVAASVGVLVHFAHADGTFSTEEREVLSESLHSLALPPGFSLERTLHAEIDLDSELRRIASAEVRDRTYNAAFSLAHADGPCSEEQHALLERIRKGLEIDRTRAGLLGRMYNDARDWLISSDIHPIADPNQREIAVHDHILKLSIISALTGAVSMPVLSIFADMLVVSLQIKLVRDVGQFWGRRMSLDAGRSIIVGVLGATGIRIAVHSLVNIIPVLGSTVGAATSFVTTCALGKVAHLYFAGGGQLQAKELRLLYQQARHDARAAYERSKQTVCGRAPALA